MIKIKNSTIIITGGAEGIGKSLVLNLLKAGAKIIVYDQKAIDYMDSFENDDRSRITYYKGDVTKKEEVKAFAKFVSLNFGKVDILINDAGASIARNTVAETPDALSKFIFDVNYWGAVYFARCFIPLLRSGAASKIVNICSIYGLFSVRERAVYCASKSALKAYSSALRLELKSKKIDVICVFPGRVNTKITENSIGWSNNSDKLHAIKIQNDRSTLSPNCAAMKIIKGIRKNKKYIYVGFDANLAKLLLRFFPVRGEIFINWLIMRVERKAKQRSLTWVKRKPLLKNLFQFEFTK
jgi:short-subunit dehydrogenase